MAKTITATTVLTKPELAVEQLYDQLAHGDLSLVIFFCSAKYDLNSLEQSLSKYFGSLEVVGCTTAGEISSTGYGQQSIVAIGFCTEYFSTSVGLVAQLDQFDLVAAQDIVAGLTDNCREQAMREINQPCSNQASFMMTLLDGLSSQEERFLSILHSAANEMPHFGGSAADDITLAKTHVYYQGHFYQQAAVVILVNTRLAFDVFSINHLEMPGEKMVVTHAQPQSRTVFELNGEPAALEYAKAHNLTVQELNPSVFALHPVAVKVGDRYFFRAIQRVNLVDNSLSFYCAVDTGIVLTVVSLGDIFDQLETKMNDIVKRYGEPELVLGCDCILRKLEVEQKKLQPVAVQLFERYNILGFNTYGEHFQGIHLNQTFTGVFIAGANGDK